MVNGQKRDVAVVVGASSKWQSDGRNTLLVHGGAVDDGDLPVGVRWGIGGAIAQRFASEGFFTVLTTRTAANTVGLEQAIRDQGGECLTVELDLVSEESITSAFERIRTEVGEPTVVVYNAGYIEGRDLPPEMELMENIPTEMFDTRNAHRQSRAVPRRQRSTSCDAGGGSRHPAVHQQLIVAARPQALHRSVALLPAHDHAELGPGADRGVFRTWRARGQCGRRRPD